MEFPIRGKFAASGIRSFLKFTVFLLIFSLFIYSGYELSKLYEIRVVRKSKIDQSQEPESNSQVLGTTVDRQNKSYPERLKIPRINVDAVIEYVGTNADGEMATPGNTFDVGWFNRGPLPGEQGTAVIDGHLDGVNGKPGVFSKLNQLIAGDRIYIQDGEGKSIIFVVRESRVLDPGYADEVFGRNDGRYLNLITCEGAWNESKKSYSKRLVVFAELGESLY